MISKIAIVGKKNVGKSSLFNLITKKKESTTVNYSGYTRDCVSELAKIKSKVFELTDTAGLDKESSILDYKTIRNTWNEIKKSNIIIYIIDITDHNIDTNLNIIKIIKKTKKNIIYIINKIDLSNDINLLKIKKDLTIQNPILISIKKHLGIELLFKELEKFTQEHNEIINKNILNLAIVGRPNVGKSTFINQISGNDNLITDPTPGTTRDSIKKTIHIKNNKYNIIDTPGVKKQSNIISNIEKIQTKHALDTIKNCNIAILITDISTPMTSQDHAILKYIKKYNKNVILIINKTDTKKKKIIIKTNDIIKNNIKNANYNFISSKYSFGIENIINEIEKIKNFQKIIINEKIIKNTINKLINYNIKNIKISKYTPLIINIKLKTINYINKNKKIYIISQIIKNFNLENISTKIIFN